MDLAAFKHRKSLADYGHAAFVKIAKLARRRIVRDATANQFPRVTPLLYRHLCHAWEWFAVLIERRSIADHEDLGMTGHRKIFLNAHPSSVVHLRFKPLACGRRSYARGPDHGLA